MPRLKPTMYQTNQVKWTVGQVAEMFCVDAQTIRDWERAFGKLHSKNGRVVRNNLGNNSERVFTAKDLQKVRTIFNLLYTEGFTIIGAKKRMEEIKQGIY